ncbi:MAG: KH domain-containing protein, partial [Spirochaetia bacterium]|nr:KH domain-containing protein [Spirochaetia bacterium]
DYIYEAEGKNKAEAERKALDVLGLNENQVTFKSANNSKGILGMVSRKPVVVRACVESGKIPIETVIKGVVLTLIQKMGMTADVENVGESDGNILVDISAEDSGILIGKQGRTIDALQFIVNLMIDPKSRDGKRIMLDIANYREKRQRRLSKLARNIADKVARTRRSIALEYMNPYERRIVHLSLEEDDRVFTRSDGNGLYKRVRILPTGGPGSDGSDQVDYDQGYYEEEY